MVKNAQMTPQMQEQLDFLVKNKTNGFDLLIKNYTAGGETEIDSARVVARLQAQYFALSPEERFLKTKKDWDNNEYFEPNEVNLDIPPVMGDKYSAFALKDVFTIYQVELPLFDFGTMSATPFSSRKMPDSSYTYYINLLQEKLGFKVAEINGDNLTQLKKGGYMSRALAKVKNAALRIARKQKSLVVSCKGKVLVKTKSDKYTLSNIEKLISVYDIALRQFIDVASKTLAKEGKKLLTPQLKYAAQLMADIYMVRATNMGGAQNCQLAEKCLWLQFAQLCNTCGFTSQELSVIVQLATKSAVDLCKKLELTPQKVVACMTLNGFTHSVVPKTLEETFIRVKEKDYTKYAGAKEQKSHTFGFADQSGALDGEQAKGQATQNGKQVQSVDDTADKASSDSQGTKKIEPNAEDHIVIPRSKAEYQVLSAKKVEAMIDEIIMKYLSEQLTKIANQLEHGCSKNKKAVYEAQSRLYGLILGYYIYTIKNKKLPGFEQGCSKSEISMAKAVCKALITRRDDCVAKICSKHIDRENKQKTTTVANAICRDITGKTVREYFIYLIKQCASVCLNQQFETQKTEAEQAAETQRLLSEKVGTFEQKEIVGEATSQEQPQAKQDYYVPDWVMLDDQGEILEYDFGAIDDSREK
ncbi:MAG: hypothetical protein E7378_00425 [Clostridiales bacterium]|nr:hypothetical protein [Clostridiales bacterium]